MAIGMTPPVKPLAVINKEAEYALLEVCNKFLQEEGLPAFALEAIVDRIHKELQTNATQEYKHSVDRYYHELQEFQKTEPCNEKSEN